MWKIRVILVTFLLLNCFNSEKVDKCLDLMQEVGKCTECHIGFFLYNGSCYEEQSGCVQQLTPQLCFTCQFGQKLQNLKCISDLEINQVNLQANPQADLPVQKQNKQKIKLWGVQKMAKPDFTCLNKANQYFRNLNLIIGNAQVLFIDAIQSAEGLIVSIGYLKNSVYFQAAGSIDYQNNITQFFFAKFLQTRQILRLSQTKQKNQNQFKSELQKTLLENIEYNESLNMLNMFYRSSDKFILYKVQTNMNVINGQSNISKIQEQPSMKTAQKIILFYAPELSKIVLKDKSQKDQNKSIAYELKYQNGAKIKIIYDKQAKGYTVEQYKIQVPLSDGIPSRPMPGGFFPITDLKDQNFVITKDYLNKNYPELKKLQILKVQLQVVNGLNVKINYKDLKNQNLYQALATKSLGGQILVRNIFKNNQSIKKIEDVKINETVNNVDIKENQKIVQNINNNVTNLIDENINNGNQNRIETKVSKLNIDNNTVNNSSNESIDHTYEKSVNKTDIVVQDNNGTKEVNLNHTNITNQKNNITANDTIIIKKQNITNTDNLTSQNHDNIVTSSKNEAIISAEKKDLINNQIENKNNTVKQETVANQIKSEINDSHQNINLNQIQNSNEIKNITDIIEKNITQSHTQIKNDTAIKDANVDQNKVETQNIIIKKDKISNQSNSQIKNINVNNTSNQNKDSLQNNETITTIHVISANLDNKDVLENKDAIQNIQSNQTNQTIPTKESNLSKQTNLNQQNNLTQETNLTKENATNAQVIQNKTSQSKTDTLLGGFQTIDTQKDPYFKDIQTKIRTDLQIVSKAKIEAAGVQVVSGLNYKVVMSLNSDVYLIEVYRNLNKQISISNVFKNGVKVEMPKPNAQINGFEWKTDQNFIKGYEFYKKEINTLNLLPIQSVSESEKDSEITYTIIYSSNEFGSFKYIKKDDKFQALSYILEGTSLYQPAHISSVNSFKSNRTIEQLLNFLQKDQNQYFPKVFLKFFSKVLTVYSLEAVSPSGIYSVQIEDTNVLNVKKLKLLSKNNCFELTDDQIVSDISFMKVQNYVRKTLTIAQEFKVSVVQVQVNPTFLKYRILYTNFNNKKLQILATLNEKNVSIINSQVLNNGYQNIPYQQLPGILQKANPIAQKTYKESLGKCKVVNAQKNLSNIKLIYADKYSTFEVVLSQDLGKAKLNKLQDKKPKLPQDFKAQNIVQFGDIKNQSYFIDLQNKINKKFGQYVLSAPILLIASQQIQQGKFIKILFQGMQGIFEAIGRYIAATNETEIYSFVLTKINKSDFIQCPDSNNVVCQKCSQDQINSNGLCFKKMEGCQTQVGNICFSCNAKWDLVQSTCVRDCSKIF